MSRSATVDFGAPFVPGAHRFRVEIPRGTGSVRIVEERGDEEEPRAVLARRIWNRIADTARQEFNARLKAAKQRCGRWHSGNNFLERLLGRELCVLAWAAEGGDDEALLVICRKWQALRPEERWWLFLKTVTEAGLPEDSERGWRRALRAALSDGEAPASPRHRRIVAAEPVTLPLFEEVP